jgi:hypothetical protein
MEQRYTSKKTYISARYSDMWLWMRIQPRVRKRVDEFWKYFLQRLSLDENKLIDVSSFNDLLFDFESLVTKQVYAMTLMDGLYQTNKSIKKIDIIKEDEKLNNLIEICFSYPTLFTSMLSSDKKKLDSYYRKHKKIIKRYDEMSGKKLSSENEKMYRDILKIRDELYDEYGAGHNSSLTKAIRVYSVRRKLNWLPKKEKSIHSTISELKKEGKL